MVTEGHEDGYRNLIKRFWDNHVATVRNNNKRAKEGIDEYVQALLNDFLPFSWLFFFT